MGFVFCAGLVLCVGLVFCVGLIIWLALVTFVVLAFSKFEIRHCDQHSNANLNLPREFIYEHPWNRECVIFAALDEIYRLREGTAMQKPHLYFICVLN